MKGIDRFVRSVFEQARLRAWLTRAKVTELGTISSGAFSAEKAIELRPDVMVLSVDTYGPARSSGLMDQLEKAGIPSVVLDFRQQPLENTVPSTILLGRMLGKEERCALTGATDIHVWHRSTRHA